MEGAHRSRIRALGSGSRICQNCVDNAISLRRLGKAGCESDKKSLLSFIPGDNRRQADAPHSCKESKCCKYERCDQEFPFVQEGNEIGFLLCRSQPLSNWPLAALASDELTFCNFFVSSASILYTIPPLAFSYVCIFRRRRSPSSLPVVNASRVAAMLETF